MRALMCGNCQASGLAVFLRKALPSWEIRDLPHLATHYNEFTKEQIADDHAWADVVFFHEKQDDPQDYPTKNPKIPLSVWFQSSPFMAQITPEMWSFYKENGGTAEEAVHHDFQYQARWDYCHARMMEKEIDEHVPMELRMSDMMSAGFNSQLQLTCNHPSSEVFLVWSRRICSSLGENAGRGFNEVDCITNRNISGLPCEESATTGARKALSLKWGGRPEDDQSGLEIARKNLNTL